MLVATDVLSRGIDVEGRKEGKGREEARSGGSKRGASSCAVAKPQGADQRQILQGGRTKGREKKGRKIGLTGREGVV